MIFKQQMSVWIFSLNLPLNFGRQWRVGRSNKEVEVSHQVWFFVCLYFLQKKKKNDDSPPTETRAEPSSPGWLRRSSAREGGVWARVRKSNREKQLSEPQSNWLLRQVVPEDSSQLFCPLVFHLQWSPSLSWAPFPLEDLTEGEMRGTSPDAGSQQKWCKDSRGDSWGEAEWCLVAILWHQREWCRRIYTSSRLKPRLPFWGFSSTSAPRFCSFLLSVVALSAVPLSALFLNAYRMFNRFVVFLLAPAQAAEGMTIEMTNTLSSS